MEADTFKTIVTPTDEILFKEKNSKFFGYAYPLTSESDVKNHIEILRKKHSGAGHFCFAWQIGTNPSLYRANDDGEPSNTAGMPIYGQIQSFGVTNILIVVVRFFGGIKLGVGGLISAYRTAAQLTLENSEIVEQIIQVHYTLKFDYKNINKVMRVIKENNLGIVSQRMEDDCTITISVRHKNSEKIFSIFDNMFEVVIKKNANLP